MNEATKELKVYNFTLDEDIYKESHDIANLSDEKLSLIENKAAQFLEKILTISVNGDEFRDFKKAIKYLAGEANRANARAINHISDRPAVITSINNFTNTNPVSNNITKLKELLNNLDPLNIKDDEQKKILGLFVVKCSIKDYFIKYQKLQFQIKSVLDVLYYAHKDVDKDNISLEVEKKHIFEHIERLEKYIYFVIKLEELLSDKIASIKEENNDKGNVVKREILDKISEQKRDFLKRQSVNIRGYKIFEYIKANNNELIKGIDYLTENIIFAIKSAIFLSGKLSKPKITLNEINKADYIKFSKDKNSSTLSDLQQKITTNSLEELKIKFDTIHESIESLNIFKAKALDDINASISDLKLELKKLNNEVKTESITPSIKNPITFQ